MSLDDLGNIGDFVGAIGVVFSLIYLAIQIRQNTRQLSQNTDSARLAAVESTNRDFNFVRNAVLRDPEVADLYLRGLRDFASLDMRDRLRFGVLLETFLFTFQASFVRSQANRYELFSPTSLDIILRQPGARQWWKRAAPRFFPAFVQFVEERLAGLGSSHESAAQQGAAADRQGPCSDQPR